MNDRTHSASCCALRTIRQLLAIALLASAAGAAACGSDEPPSLEGALRPIAVFAPSLGGRRESTYDTDDPATPGKYSRYTWHLSTASPWTDVDAFYKGEWPSASREEDANTVTFRDPPRKAGEMALAEGASVTIHKAAPGARTEFEVSEQVLAEKRP